MKLLTHNMLTSKCLKDVSVGYPLGLNVFDKMVVNVDYNEEFIQKMLLKIDYDVLVKACKELGLELPNEIVHDNEEFYRRLHHCLMEVEIVEGELVCPETQRVFPIRNGIPNMLCNEDEVQ